MLQKLHHRKTTECKLCFWRQVGGGNRNDCQRKWCVCQHLNDKIEVSQERRVGRQWRCPQQRREYESRHHAGERQSSVKEPEEAQTGRQAIKKGERVWRGCHHQSYAISWLGLYPRKGLKQWDDVTKSLWVWLKAWTGRRQDWRLGRQRTVVAEIEMRNHPAFC